jgi:uncharacterized protein (DUF934 family)
MALISEGRFIDDAWRRLADEDALPKAGNIIVPEARLPEALAARNPQLSLGVVVANTSDPATLVPHFESLRLIAIAFPAFSDGRGFSLARLLRRAGFTGELRASGRVVADQYMHAVGCGFDTIQIPEDLARRQDEAQWRGALAAYSGTYQRGYAGRSSILEARRKAAQ